MSTTLVFNAIAPGVHRKIEVTERDVSNFDTAQTTRREIAYRVYGSKLRDGSLYSQHWTREEVIGKALRCFRSHNPKARLIVTWCAICRTGSAPDIKCEHCS